MKRNIVIGKGEEKFRFVVPRGTGKNIGDELRGSERKPLTFGQRRYCTEKVVTEGTMIYVARKNQRVK